MLSFLRRGAQGSKGLVLLGFDTDGIVFLHVFPSTDSKPTVSRCDFLPCDLNNRATVLRKHIRKNKLQGADCACVLNPMDYRLLLLDSPNVPPEELKSATHFLIKDLIDFSIGDAAIDIFEVPMSGKKPKMYTVAVQMDLLKKITRLIQDAGLNLCHIDIAELALRNVLALWQDTGSGLALLFERAKGIHLVIVQGDAVCFARKVYDLSADVSVDLKQLEAELRQSFAYYQSQIAENSLSKIWVAPMRVASTDKILTLADHLSLSMEGIDLNTLLGLKKPLDKKLQARCLLLLAEALQTNKILKSIEELE